MWEQWEWTYETRCAVDRYKVRRRIGERGWYILTGVFLVLELEMQMILAGERGLHHDIIGR